LALLVQADGGGKLRFTRGGGVHHGGHVAANAAKTLLTLRLHLHAQFAMSITRQAPSAPASRQSRFQRVFQ
jgi:hypothetical protein